MQILVTDPIADAGIDQLRDAGATVTIDTDLSGDSLAAAVGGVDALLVRSGTAVTAAVFDAADRLQFVGRAGIGVDNIDIEAATAAGVIVANAPDGNVRAAAEHTVAMLFAVARSIPQAHGRLHDGEWAKSAFLGVELNGKTLGIVGLGRVGQEVARRVAPLGMELLAYDPYISAERAELLGVELVDLETCLREATFVTVHTPLTPETAGLLGADELALLADSYLINCARGGIIDEAALAEALADGTVAGAGLDTFADEPIDAEHPLVGIDTAVLTPHLGASTVAAQTDVSASVAQQALAALAGEPVSHAINAPSVDETVYQQIRPYVELAVTAGKIAAQLLEGRIGTVEVSYAGEIAAEDVEIITAAALQGVFEPLEWQVNTVNAPRIAADRGIEVTETKSRQSADFQSLIGVTVGDGDTELGVFGTLFTGDEPRIVRIDEYRVDAIPHGRMLVATNADAPGVIGFIGTVLGEHAINIAGMYNARRDEPGGEAMTVYSLDDPIPPEVEAVLEEDDRIIDVTYLEL